MKYLYIPVAFCIIVVLLVVYFSAVFVGGIFGCISDIFEWISVRADVAIMQLEKWGDSL
jgi:hypothetical protein